MKWHATVRDRALVFKSQHHENLFFEKENGKNVLIERDEPSGWSQYKFLNGAVIPYIFYQHPVGWKTLADAREAVLFEFCPKRYVKTLSGATEAIRASTAGKNKAWIRTLIDRVIHWMMENGYEVPDHKEYKRWENSAPAADEEYPPLVRIKELWKARQLST